MMKRFMIPLFCAAALCLSAADNARPAGHRDARGGRNFPRGERPKFPGRNFPKPDQSAPKHPLISVLENGDFTPEERTRLKALAEKDPKAFGLEMRKRFMLRRKQEAQRTLALRETILNAKNAQEKERATQELRTELEKRADRRLSMHKKILDETEKNIRSMQERCDKLRKEYEARVNSKSANVDADMKQILSPEPPQYLLDAANLDPEKPPRRGPEKRSR